MKYPTELVSEIKQFFPKHRALHEALDYGHPMALDYFSDELKKSNGLTLHPNQIVYLFDHDRPELVYEDAKDAARMWDAYGKLHVLCEQDSKAIKWRTDAGLHRMGRGYGYGDSG